MMNIRSKITLITALPVILSACSPHDMETDPVQITTDKGIVTCQLYQSTTTTWDRAIDQPATMSVREANKACVDEGQRIIDAKKPKIITGAKAAL